MAREGIEIKKIIKEKRKRIISICAVIFFTDGSNGFYL